MIKNKKGFTLVELLAVIVVLAIILLIASNNIFGQIIKARKNALSIEGTYLVDAATTAYQNAILEQEITTGSACFSLEYLYQEGLFSKGAADHYSGSVLVKPNGNQVTYTFWITNGSFSLTGDKGKVTGEDAIESAEASTNCGSISGAKEFTAS